MKNAYYTGGSKCKRPPIAIIMNLKKPAHERRPRWMQTVPFPEAVLGLSTHWVLMSDDGDSPSFRAL